MYNYLRPLTDHVFLRQFAEDRKKLHIGHDGNLKTDVYQEYFSLVGEDTFGAIYGYGLDKRLRISGDGGVDYLTYIGTVDIKTYLRPKNLVLEVAKAIQVADILILARYDEATDSAELLGWDYGYHVKTFPIGCLPGHTIVNYIEPAVCLYPMSYFTKLHQQEKERLCHPIH